VVRKYSLQIKIGLLMMMAVLLLSATGYLSYHNISLIVSSMHVEIKPDQRLLSIRDISIDLEKAESCIRLYSITKDTSEIIPYYGLISGIDSKVKKFRSETLNDTLLTEQVDTVSRLIGENIIIWNELLYLNHNDKVVQSLKQLSDSIDSVSDKKSNSEKGILWRVFSRDKTGRLNEKELVSDLQKIEQLDRATRVKLMSRESQLAKTGREIKEKFYDLISKIEVEITSGIDKKASAADRLADHTLNWLILFSVSGLLLALLVVLVVIRYVRKTFAYEAALKKSKLETENLARMKEMFMANVSHEIRTPVTAISGFTEQLLHGKFDEDTRQILNIIKTSSDHLARVINDILDFSKMQNGKLSLEKVNFNIRQVMEDVYSLFEKDASGNNISLSFSISHDTPTVLLGDPYRLKQIIINLVSNSVKFTKDGKVHFSVKCNKTDSAKIELIIEVADTGIGIDENKLNLIFDDFTQAEMSTTRHYGGTGLGLSIVKKLVELHQGTIECKSTKNLGTTMICRIPCVAGDQNQVKEHYGSVVAIPDEVRNLNILIVDDGEYNRLLFKTILDRWNVNYSEAENSLKAFDLLREENFDLVFMDVRMPGIDGLKATRFIRNELNIRASEMPVICVSAATVSEDWQKYEKAGVNAFIQKPFTEEMLLTTILTVIKDNDSDKNLNKSEQSEETPEVSGKFDLQSLYLISGGDETFTREMVAIFISSTGKGLDEMHNEILSGNWNGVADIAHKISPPCRHIGASFLNNLLKRIEDGIKNKADTRIVETLYMDSMREFEKVKTNLTSQV
jgi:signal transduction histidine kinase/CheY-like chemotaxis protein/HPt (histidine-containing phosphotransfer) domain-containing protein